MNNYLVRELIDLNFDTENYPILRCQKITKTDTEKIANTLSTLTSGGIIKADGDLEDYMRDLLGLPAKSEEEEPIEDPNAPPED